MGINCTVGVVSVSVLGYLGWGRQGVVLWSGGRYVKRFVGVRGI